MLARASSFSGLNAGAVNSTRVGTWFKDDSSWDSLWCSFWCSTRVGTWFKDDSSWDSLWCSFWCMGIRVFQLLGVCCIRVLGSGLIRPRLIRLRVEGFGV